MCTARSALGYRPATLSTAVDREMRVRAVAIAQIGFTVITQIAIVITWIAIVSGSMPTSGPPAWCAHASDSLRA